jgi:hypothetical protein
LSLHDPAVVGAEYQDETRLAATNGTDHVRELYDEVPRVEGPIRARRTPAIFVAEK